MADYYAASKIRRRTSTGMGGVSALPEQLQHEVFSRVGDIKALFRFATTCRRWLRRFTDPAFLRGLCPGQGRSGHRARLLGVFVQARMMTMAEPPQRVSSPALAPVFLPALGSPLGPAGRALPSFGGGGDDDGTFDDAKPLAARRGIVLVQLAPRPPEEMDCQCHLLGVCNPVTGDRHVLPPLDWSLTREIVVGYAIITAADRRKDSDDHPPAAVAAARWTLSQLLVITQHEDSYSGGDAYLHSYSAATRSWSAPTVCLESQDRRVFSLVGDRSAVVHRGAAHWLCVDDWCWDRAIRGEGNGHGHHLYRLSVDVATASVSSLTRLPVRDAGQPLLCVTGDGELAVSSVHPLHVTVWNQPGGARDDDDNDDTTPAAAAWPRTSARIPVSLSQWRHHQQRWCNLSNGSLVALFRDKGVFILDLGTKVIEEAMGFQFQGASGDKRCLTCVPYEMDLVEFFTLQLVAYESDLELGIGN